jgi:hypothetical protein
MKNFSDFGDGAQFIKYSKFAIPLRIHFTTVTGILAR